MSLLTLSLGAGAGALALHEHQARRNAERLAAALFETLLNAIDATDAQTGAHVRRVAHYSLVIADAAGLETHDRRTVERVALFHDIGKISEALFDIIHDERKLSPKERDEIATHPARGAQVLAPLDAFYPELAEGVLSHHERWDGTGYPRRLVGEAIPFTARIVALADTFDAVTFSRRYRPGQSNRIGGEVIGQGRETQFDPLLTDLFLSPPVFECIEEARQALCAPHPKRADRRAAHVEDAPDVRFRWRTATPPRPLPGLKSQKSP